ncbi:carcinoembryonic antigen-related cell adhesion molecule 16-like isoform X2 [Tachyglossus aculeatus]|uniref:carcinoembryonic antigen-related cell adhesion molecule 16-like isoform X2 n=1 Tax=Tachyglossus aculeatus TaxID=9261 RepID=UPI0018F6AEC3|nr:carcinoembryonic antigen-related cell adhesion molecule 16-like isoform X2 [Tachyglossus aculeatus]
MSDSARTGSGWMAHHSGGHDPPRCRDCAWMGILFTASVLCAWLPTASLQVTLVSIPPQPAEDQDVTLSVRGAPRTTGRFHWYRGRVLPATQILVYDIATQKGIPGPAHTGREVGLADGSLQIREVREDDAGQYTVQVFSLPAGSPPLTGTVDLQLSVSGLRIVPVPRHPRVGGDVTLSLQGLSGLPKSYTWYRGAAGGPHRILRYNTHGVAPEWFPGQAHSGRETGTVNGSLLLQAVSPEDSGRYIVHVVTTRGQEEASITIEVSLRPTTTPAEKAPVPSPAASRGIIAAMVVGILVGTSLLGVLGYWLLHVRRRSRGPPRLEERISSGGKMSALQNRDQGNAYEDLDLTWKKATDPRGTTVPDLQVGNANIYSELQLPA